MPALSISRTLRIAIAHAVVPSPWELAIVYVDHRRQRSLAQGEQHQRKLRPGRQVNQTPPLQGACVGVEGTELVGQFTVWYSSCGRSGIITGDRWYLKRLIQFAKAGSRRSMSSERTAPGEGLPRWVMKIPTAAHEGLKARRAMSSTCGSSPVQAQAWVRHTADPCDGPTRRIRLRPRALGSAGAHFSQVTGGARLLHYCRALHLADEAAAGGPALPCAVPDRFSAAA